MAKRTARKSERRIAPAGPDTPAATAHRWLDQAGVPRQPPSPAAWHRAVAADPELQAALDAIEEPDWSRAVTADAATAIEAAQAAASDAFHAAVWSTLDRALLGHRLPSEIRFLRAWLPWWAQHAPPTHRLIDVGAGAGLLACGYAAFRDDVSVVAV
jgi:hypothetical protein